MSILLLAALSKSIIETELLALFPSFSSKISEFIMSEDDRICRMKKLSILIAWMRTKVSKCKINIHTDKGYIKYKENKYRRTSTTISLINYHFMSCPRYKRKLFLNNGLDKRFKALVKAISKTNDFKIITVETDKDHWHLFINPLPTYSPSDIMAKIKGETSKILRVAFKEFRFMPSLWTRSYFVSTVGNIPIETIKNYVENQRKR